MTPKSYCRSSLLFRPSFTAVLILINAIVGVSITNTSQGNAAPDCLNSDRSGGTFLLGDHPECKDDVFRVSENVDVQQVEKMFGIAPNQVTFIGCAVAPFETRMVRTDPPFHFQILYKVSAYSKSREYAAPIFHELGHVYQLTKAGSLNKLFQSLDSSIERVELGADFLAGLAAQRLKMNPEAFQTSLFLTGSYDSKKPDSHGCPEARSSAFRYGLHAPPTKSFDDAQYADFQDNEFAMIKHSGVPQCSN